MICTQEIFYKFRNPREVMIITHGSKTSLGGGVYDFLYCVRRNLQYWLFCLLQSVTSINFLSTFLYRCLLQFCHHYRYRSVDNPCTISVPVFLANHTLSYSFRSVISILIGCFAYLSVQVYAPVLP